MDQKLKWNIAVVSGHEEHCHRGQEGKLSHGGTVCQAWVRRGVRGGWWKAEGVLGAGGVFG